MEGLSGTPGLMALFCSISVLDHLGNCLAVADWGGQLRGGLLLDFLHQSEDLHIGLVAEQGQNVVDLLDAEGQCDVFHKNEVLNVELNKCVSLGK